MEKLGEEWSSNTVTSMYKIKHINGRPFGCNTEEDVVYTEPNELGWRFGIRYDINSPEFEVYFFPHATSEAVTKLAVTAGLRAEKARDGDFNRVSEQKIYERPAQMKERRRIVYWYPANVVAAPILSFKVEFEGVNLDHPKSPKRQIMNRALGDSLSTGGFIDTRFFVFSRRLPSNGAGCPMPIYANSSILKGKCKFFEKYLSNVKSSGPCMLDFDSDVPWEEMPHVEDYDYPDDSDLDEDEDRGDSSSDSSASAAQQEEGRDDITLTDSIIIEDQHIPFHGRTLLVKDFAYTTWKAFIYYLYTGEVMFAPLKSEKLRNHRLDEIYPPPCSAKSMYRLAEKLGHDDLKDIAFKSMRSKLSESNILHEAFSKFTSRYPKVQAMEIDILCDHYGSANIRDEFPAKMKEIAEGKLQHSPGVLVALCHKLAQKGR